MECLERRVAEVSVGCSADVSPQVKINGQHVTSNRGDVVRDFLVQADRQWYRYLEELVCRPGAPNPFKQIEEPDLRSAVQARGYLADKETISTGNLLEIMNKSKLTFDLELDDNNVPKKIIMNSSDNQAEDVLLKSLMIAAWDQKTKETLIVPLWTKDMMVNEMFIMYHQTLMSMANTLSKSTGQDKLAGALRDYCKFFAEETKIIESK